MEKIYTDCKRPIMGKARLPKMRKRDVASLKDASRERSIMFVELGALFYPGENCQHAGEDMSTWMPAGNSNAPAYQITV